jgi:hypothetical protein
MRQPSKHQSQECEHKTAIMAIHVSHPRQTQDSSPHSTPSAGDGSSVVYQGMRWSGAGGSAVHAHFTAARDSSAPMLQELSDVISGETCVSVSQRPDDPRVRSGRLSLDWVKGPATQPLHSSARKRVFGCTCEHARPLACKSTWPCNCSLLRLNVLCREFSRARPARLLKRLGLACFEPIQPPVHSSTYKRHSRPERAVRELSTAFRAPHFRSCPDEKIALASFSCRVVCIFLPLRSPIAGPYCASAECVQVASIQHQHVC